MTPRYFALVPAAGHSARMGEPKLLMPVAGQPLIAHTLAAWERSRVDQIVVVVRPGNDELTEAVKQECGSKVQSPKSKVEIVIPATSPQDMKASVHTVFSRPV